MSGGRLSSAPTSADPTTADDPAGPAVALRARNLRVTYQGRGRQVEALGPFDLDVLRGEFVCIVGPSGCGKSTLLKVASGLTTPSTGTLELRVDSSARAAIATVFQDYGIFPWKTVLENVALALRATGLNRRAAALQAREWLTRMGLGQFTEMYPGALSGGMQQRVAIARALSVEPDILLMDEPFAALDAQLRELLQEELLAVCQADQRTVLFVTHSLDEALILADRTIMMTSRPGRVLDLTDIPFRRPRDPSIRQSAEFQELRGQLWDHLRTQVTTQAQRMEQMR